MDISVIIGKNIKEIREKKKLSLDMAADLTGVSRSMLAQIEKGDVNPTVQTLWKIMEGFKVPFNRLIYRTPPLASIIRKDESDIYNNSGNKDYRSYVTFPFDESKGFETNRCFLSPGAVHTSTGHIAGTEEFITVFSGRMEITVGHDSFILEEGDSIRFLADTNHSYRNIGDVPLTYHTIMYYSS
ncbi:MAG: helix-turn-helix transcriptional regulator [Oscillospiraceae bacterium]|nr:helix-turn-helix transcriptional regulator [Oscillospiraceae bacterium]